MHVGIELVRLLEKYGVTQVFGIPGTHSIELYRGIEASEIRHVLPRHEQGAGFMADGYARMTGKPGVCFVITGPGVTNIATAIGQAASDSVPLLVISPVNDPLPDASRLAVQDAESVAFNHGRLHEIGDQAAVTRPLCVFSDTARSADDIPTLLQRAFDVFASKRPGPVHINIPLSILRSEVSEPWQTGLLSTPPEPDQKLLELAVDILQAATHPVIVAGGGCRHFGELVVALAEKIASPIVTTVAGRGVVDGSHPLTPGAQLAAPACRELVANADVALIVGSELAEPDYWTDNLLLPVVQIWINLDDRLLANRGEGVCLQADARIALPSLSAKLAGADVQAHQEAHRRCRAARELNKAGFSSKMHGHWRVLTELWKHLPAGVCVYSDMTQLAYTALDYLPLPFGSFWLHPNGYGTLGYGLPAAIGGKLGEPETPVLVIVGDSGLQYTLQEMAVAAEHQLNIVVLLWQNQGLRQIEDDMIDAGIEPVAVQQQDPDFIALAEVFGWEAHRVDGLYALGELIPAAFAATGPVLLELDAASV